jgi:DNA-binding Lrp family transcriptional regulator
LPQGLRDDLDRRLVVATQSGLPLVAQPYHAVAAALGTTAEDVQNRLAWMLDAGIIRRIGAVPNHYAIGYTVNGMTVWDVDDRLIDELGSQVGRLEFVTHCYRRPRRLPDWPYNLFAMVHGSNRQEVEQKTAQIAALLGGSSGAHEVLYSSRILKKSGLRIAG